MAMELWELEQRRLGNINAANQAHQLREEYGDVALPTPDNANNAQSKENSSTTRRDIIIGHFRSDKPRPGFYPITDGEYYGADIIITAASHHLGYDPNHTIQDLTTHVYECERCHYSVRRLFDIQLVGLGIRNP